MNKKINTIGFIFLFVFLISAVSAANIENETSDSISQPEPCEDLSKISVENNGVEKLEVENVEKLSASKDTQKVVKKKKNDKPGLFKRMGMKVKEIFSELKKVDWPTFGKVVKQTGVVIAVVVIFLVIIFGFNTGLQELLKLMTNR